MFRAILSALFPELASRNPNVTATQRLLLILHICTPCYLHLNVEDQVKSLSDPSRFRCFFLPLNPGLPVYSIK